jgi:hypothetical protein
MSSQLSSRDVVAKPPIPLANPAPLAAGVELVRQKHLAAAQAWDNVAEQRQLAEKKCPEREVGTERLTNSLSPVRELRGPDRLDAHLALMILVRHDMCNGHRGLPLQ